MVSDDHIFKLLTLKQALFGLSPGQILSSRQTLYTGYYSTLLIILWAYWGGRMKKLFHRHLAYDALWSGFITSSFAIPTGLYGCPKGFIYLVVLLQMAFSTYRRWLEKEKPATPLMSTTPISRVRNPIIPPLFLPNPWILSKNTAGSFPGIPGNPGGIHLGNPGGIHLGNPGGRPIGIASIIEPKSKNEVRTEPSSEAELLGLDS